MYTCLMPLFNWELAEVAMVEDVLERERKKKKIKNTNSKQILCSNDSIRTTMKSTVGVVTPLFRRHTLKGVFIYSAFRSTKVFYSIISFLKLESTFVRAKLYFLSVVEVGELF